MKLQRTFQGLEATLKTSGIGRFGGATFLGVWLTIWTAGEAFVIWILVWGGWSLLTGQPPGEGKAPLEPAPALAAGLFLLGWLAFWTFGGLLAWGELLRTLFGYDRFILRPDGLEVVHGYGLFRTRQSVPRDRLRRFYLASTRCVLAAETTGGTVEFAQLGSAAERKELVQALNDECGFSAESPATAVLPEAWHELTSPEGQAILVKNPTGRRQQAVVMWVVFLIVAFVAAVILNATRQQLSLGALAAIISAVAGFAGWGAYRLTFSRNEWVLRDGRLVLQKRFRRRVVARFEGNALQLQEDKDSDGDPWYRLKATPSGATDARILPGARGHGREVATASQDPTELRSMGLWLAERCGIPFTDRTTTTAKAEDYEKMKQQLAASGRLGAWAARVLDKVAPKPR